MTTMADSYVDPDVLDLSDADLLAGLKALYRLNTIPEYRVQAMLVVGDKLTDLSPYLVKDDSSQVSWDCTANIPASARLNLATDLQWGSDVVQLYQLIRSVAYNQAAGYNLDAYLRFPIYRFVATSPGYDDLDVYDVHSVTGYDINYLLQSSLDDAYPFDYNTEYGDNVQALMRAAGVLGGSAPLSDLVDYPGDWYTKTLPAPQNYTPDSTNTFLDAINALLKASGMRQLYNQPRGRWRIEATPKPSSQPPRWRWAGSSGGDATDDDLALKVVQMHQSAYSGDVYNAPNRWRFIQNGLTFEPVEGSGQYTVDNVGTAPSGQAVVGRVLLSTQYLDASGQTDLETQGDAIVAAQLAQTERITLRTAAWPVAQQFDVFNYLHRALPFSPSRRVQTQQWTLPLWGQQMEWSTYAVAAL